MKGLNLVLLVGAAIGVGTGTYWGTTKLLKSRHQTVAAEDSPSPANQPNPKGSDTPSKKSADKTSADPQPKAVAVNRDYQDKIVPLLAKYCTSCHSDAKATAGLSLEKYKDETAILNARKVWEAVKENVHSREMPPKKSPQPTQAERDTITQWVEQALTRIDCGSTRDPGHPTIRRLNRAEYNNTIRDLVGIDFRPADDFPTDDVGFGFDNSGDVLSMPPILLEKYLAAAEKILDKAIVIQKPVVSQKDSFRPQNLFSSLGRDSKQNDRIALTSNGAAFFPYDFLHEGEYVIRVKVYGDQAGDQLPKLVIQLDRNDLKSFDVDAVKGKSKTYETRTKITAGRHTIGGAFTNDFLDKEKNLDRNLYVELMELEGPFGAKGQTPPLSHQKIMIARPTGASDKEAAARKVIQHFTTRAYRRPVTDAEIGRLLKLFKMADADGEAFERAIQLTLRAVLVSPHFLFRIERDKEPANPKAVHPVNEFELATRLSYFLWSTMPDEELYQLAEQGKLRQPGVLEAQVQRMVKDPKSVALTANFASQWLQLRTLQSAAPDKGTYPQYDPALKTAMVRETELYFEHLLKENRSILEFLDSDYSFVNERLAKHYGIPDVKGDSFRKVTLTDKNRGGIVTHASVLTLTSNPTRTSPVKRGKWILENIFGTPPPPPDPNAELLKEDQQSVLKGTLRQRMEQHRANPGCATCHQKMDPLGFGLENFDGVGSWRAMEGKFKIDTTGVLPGGEKFDGPKELRTILLGKADLFRRCFAEKMLTYALGRGLEYYDKCAVDDITAAVKKGDDRIVSVILAVVQSDPFQKRRGK